MLVMVSLGVQLSNSFLEEFEILALFLVDSAAMNEAMVWLADDFTDAVGV